MRIWTDAAAERYSLFGQKQLSRAAIRPIHAALDQAHCPKFIHELADILRWVTTPCDPFEAEKLLLLLLLNVKRASRLEH